MCTCRTCAPSCTAGALGPRAVRQSRESRGASRSPRLRGFAARAQPRGTAGVDGDALGHLGGTIGAGSKACTALVALNCGGCRRIQDRGLQALGRGCRWLQFASFADCELVGDAGAAGLARGCHGLRFLTCRCCSVGNASMRSLAEHCRPAVAQPAAAAASVTRLQALSQGCRMLQSLNIASCAKVTEGGVCAVAVGSSKTVQLLNMTGCERIAASSLEHLLNGLPFCERAETFFGFKAKPNALEQKLKVQQRVINDAAALNSRLRSAVLSCASSGSNAGTSGG